MMKKRMKKTIALLGLTLAVMSSSIPALAASCLSVRDYGHHKYDHRDLGWRVTSRVVNGTENGKWVVYVTSAHYGKCVCGSEAITETKTERKLESRH